MYAWKTRGKNVLLSSSIFHPRSGYLNSESGFLEGFLLYKINHNADKLTHPVDPICAFFSFAILKIFAGETRMRLVPILFI